MEVESKRGTPEYPRGHFYSRGYAAANTLVTEAALKMPDMEAVLQEIANGMAQLGHFYYIAESSTERRVLNYCGLGALLQRVAGQLYMEHWAFVVREGGYIFMGKKQENKMTDPEKRTLVRRGGKRMGQVKWKLIAKVKFPFLPNNYTTK